MNEGFRYHQLSSWNKLEKHPNASQGNDKRDSNLFEGGFKIRLDYQCIPEQHITDVISRRYTAKEIRAFEDFSLKELGTYLKWSVGRRFNENTKRFYPSAGANYPNHIFLFIKHHASIDNGLYWYDSEDHSIVNLSGNVNYEDALLQEGIAANLCAVIASDFSLSYENYGERGYRFCLLEAGHMAQNMMLISNAIGWKSAPIGGFKDEVINQLFGNEFKALYLIPIGK
ncbi:SagB-type dehydrogenase domain-containing protein [Oceanobacillus limi]|uniref:SagB-type dehydrogenase domain-containing protein n=1 Tax=Oceanobacillus limi TaxID=930131 RepID=A0A1H9Y3J5_9BACI|nr:SagB/ThcOx family dehydrogenase [Oceanobacillus limi]SES63379.1 SagB-type dehydrogenase domain-containing protein [Oceanobacillus limi]